MEIQSTKKRSLYVTLYWSPEVTKNAKSISSLGLPGSEGGLVVKAAPWNGHSAGSAGQAVHTAAEATGGTGSLIKNTAPFQQLQPGPKWNLKESRWPGGTALSGHGAASYIFQLYIRAKECTWTFKTLSGYTHSLTQTHNTSSSSRRSQKWTACRFI